ncbi:mannitol dehydrogenase family protein [Roseiconus lacunae]|nr:mannitol dehydrogenase family protein [Stieleria sp. HD01]
MRIRAADHRPTNFVINLALLGARRRIVSTTHCAATSAVFSPDGHIENRVIGCLTDFVLGCDNPESVLQPMAAPATKIMSLTITEGGYNIDHETGEFDFSNPDVIHDLEHPKRPRLIFGFLTEALRRRRDAGLSAFTVQSCDNIQHNGNLTRKVVLDFADRQDPDLAKWIDVNASFPNAMVDRITPATTDADINYLEQEFGLLDQWPVTCEPFEQWVIEDKFCNGRPEWERVGVHFVDDVTPYETMKLRLLNAGHSVLGLLGALHGYQTIRECVEDQLFKEFLRNYLDLEATPTLDAVEGIDLDAYKDTLIKRFGNPAIRDSVARICQGSSDKIPVFMIPTIIANLQRGGSINYAALVIASWCHYCARQSDRHGEPLEVNDLMKDELIAAARKTSDDKLAFLKLKSIFGNLADEERFTRVYESMITALNASSDVANEMRGILKSDQN